MDRSQIIVQQLHVTPGYLERRRTVAEDSLQREDVAAIGEECPREAVAEDVGRASSRDASGQREAADKLLDRSRSQATASSADEERIRIDDTSTRDDQGSKRSPRAAANRYDPLLRALAHDTTATFDQIDVADRQSNEFPKSQPGVEQHEKNRSITDGWE